MKEKVEERKGLEPAMVEEEDRGEVDGAADMVTEVVATVGAVEAMEAAAGTVAVEEDMEVVEVTDGLGETSIAIETAIEGLSPLKKVKRLTSQ